jgi:acetylornithine deacetylase/succinyl-diaminopimelate desuccinylase-like protein
MTENTERTIEHAIGYARQNELAFLEGFQELLRIPSVSADPAYKGDVQRAAEWLVGEMDRIGLKNCQALPSAGHPVAYGEWLEAGDDRPTLLVYAHYDVQPVDPLDRWDSPPFEPAVRDGNLYARGVIDNKCGAYINLKAFESFLETAGRLPVNVKLFFEGEEESGSPSMGAFIARHRDLLAADLLILSDGGSLPDQPKCLTSTRGIVDGEVTVSGPKRDLHSGTYGGFVHNPVHLVAQIIAAFHDEEGRVQIPGFYEAVLPAGPAVQEQLKAMEPVLLPEYESKSGVKAFWGIPEYEVLERGTAQPTLDVNGIYGGYQGVGGMTIIPASAGFKVSMRLVADQDPDNVSGRFEEFVRSFACPSLDVEVRMDPGSWPAELLHEGPEIDVLQRAYRATWGQEALLYREGGSVPVLGMFHRELGMPMMQLAFGVGDNGHAPNEYLRLEYFPRGIDLAIHFYQYLGDAALS